MTPVLVHFLYRAACFFAASLPRLICAFAFTNHDDYGSRRDHSCIRHYHKALEITRRPLSLGYQEV